MGLENITIREQPQLSYTINGVVIYGQCKVTSYTEQRQKFLKGKTKETLEKEKRDHFIKPAVSQYFFGNRGTHGGALECFFSFETHTNTDVLKIHA